MHHYRPQSLSSLPGRPRPVRIRCVRSRVRQWPHSNNPFLFPAPAPAPIPDHPPFQTSISRPRSAQPFHLHHHHPPSDLLSPPQAAFPPRRSSFRSLARACGGRRLDPSLLRFSPTHHTFDQHRPAAEVASNNTDSPGRRQTNNRLPTIDARGARTQTRDTRIHLTPAYQTRSIPFDGKRLQQNECDDNSDRQRRRARPHPPAVSPQPSTLANRLIDDPRTASPSACTIGVTGAALHWFFFGSGFPL